METNFTQIQHQNYCISKSMLLKIAVNVITRTKIPLKHILSNEWDAMECYDQSLIFGLD